MNPPPSGCSHISFLANKNCFDACCFECLGRASARRQHLHLEAPEQLGQCGHARRVCPAPIESAGAPRPAPPRCSHLGRLPSAPECESRSRLRACQHLPALCAGAHDSMASTVGRVRVLAIARVSTERAPRPPSSICVWLCRGIYCVCMRTHGHGLLPSAGFVHDRHS